MLTSILSDMTMVRIPEEDTSKFFQKACNAFKEVIKLCGNDFMNTKDLHLMSFYEFVDDNKTVRTISSPERFELFYIKRHSDVELYKIAIVRSKEGIVFDVSSNASIEKDDIAFSMFKNVASCFVDIKA